MPCPCPALPHQTLALRNCAIDPAALTRALTPRARLKHPKLCLGRCTHTPGEVAAALLPLCINAPALERVTLWCIIVGREGLAWGLSGCEAVCEVVRQGLGAVGQGRKVQLEVVEEQLDVGCEDLP